MQSIRCRDYPFEGTSHLILSRFFGRNRVVSDAIVIRTYESIVAAARQPLFFRDWNVPDTALGRFESLSLHMILFLHRTKNASAAAQGLAQEVVEEFFKDVDHSLRELGIGDAGVPKRMKKLAKMFYGRAASYDSAINNSDREALAQALQRNMLPDVTEWRHGAEFAGYVLNANIQLANLTDEAIIEGNLRFQSPTLA
jgi:cytochrome b pre-mRNA-processing protein 3